MLFEEIARTSADVTATRARLAKVERLAACLSRLGAEEVPVAAAYLSGTLPQGTIGVGWASLRDLPPPATSATLQLFEVHAVRSDRRSVPQLFEGVQRRMLCSCVSLAGQVSRSSGPSLSSSQ